MSNETFELSKTELEFKNMYIKFGTRYLDKPMTYSEYEALPENMHMLSENIHKYHNINPISSDINTIKDHHSLNEDGMVTINLHGRYSYPLLHNHEYVELIYIYSGKCNHFIDGSKIEMKEGDFCIVSPGTMHAISAYDDDAVILNIIVSQDFFGKSFINILRDNPVMVNFFENIIYGKDVSPYILYPTGNDPWMHQFILWAYKEKSKKDYLYSESMSLYVRQIFVYLLRNYEVQAVVANPINHSQENNIVALISYITINYDHITLNSVADFFGYNITYLSQLLKKCTGKTFTEMISEARVSNACQLLTDTNLPVTEIAQRIGCYDASHFTRLFKMQMEMTPTQYRNQR